MDSAAPVLTIDGPSGSGKGTISRIVAQRLGWHYLDSGALYRAVGVAAGWADLDLDDGRADDLIGRAVAGGRGVAHTRSVFTTTTPPSSQPGSSTSP